MKKISLILIVIVSVWYGYYKYPELFRMAERIVMHKVYQTIPKIKKYANNCIEWVEARTMEINTCKYEIYDERIVAANAYIEESYSKMQNCKMAFDKKLRKYKNRAENIKMKISSVDSLYALVMPEQKTDAPTSTVKESSVNGDIYDIKYDISYKGHRISAHSRSVGKPKVSCNEISYIMPTGQRYYLMIPDGEGSIKMRSTEKIVNS